MAQISGQRTTGNILAARKVVDMDKEIHLLDPNKAPLLRLMKGADEAAAVLKSRPTGNVYFQWMEDDVLPRWDAINNAAGYSAAATTWAVDNGTRFGGASATSSYLILVPRTGEIAKCTAQATNNLTVVRGWGTTAAAALVDNDPILIIGTTSQEGTTSRTSLTTLETSTGNYVQNFRNPVEITHNLQASELYGGDDLTFQRRKVAIEHAVDIERALLFGQPKVDATGTNTMWGTGGVLYFITTNVTNVGGPLTETILETVCRNAFRYGSKEKVLLCSPLLVSVISSWAGAKYRENDILEKRYGLGITDYISPHGRLHIVSHWLLEGDVYGGYGIILDVDKCVYRYQSANGLNLDTKLHTNIQANDSASQKDEYRTTCGLQLVNEKAHAVVTGVTG